MMSQIKQMRKKKIDDNKTVGKNIDENDVVDEKRERRRKIKMQTKIKTQTKTKT